MLYHITYQIQIGAYRVQTLVSCAVHRSVEQLSDTARIVLPGTLHNAAVEVEDKIHVGDMVTISLGYSETGVQTEFKGYLKSIQTDGPNIILECEDQMYLWDVSVPDRQYNKKTDGYLTSIKTVLQYLAQHVDNACAIDCDFDFKYESLSIYKATALQVLKKIQEDTKADIYFEDGTLHIHPVYSKTGNKVIYDMAVNVNASDLKYVRQKDKKLKVEVSYTDDKGLVRTKTFGLGDKVVKRTVNSSDDESLQRAAENEYNLWCYDGYEGGLTAWLVPYCKPSDIAEVRDREYEYKNGSYYVVATDTEFSSSGGRRKVILGRKMSS